MLKDLFDEIRLRNVFISDDNPPRTRGRGCLVKIQLGHSCHATDV